MTNALDLIDDCIADLEAKLGLQPGQELSIANQGKEKGKANKKNKNEKKKSQPKPSNAPNETQPHICKLEFKVGQITKVWVHPDADKLYCEEIDVGEDAPRQIASGLRPHFSEEEMLGQRLLVVSNLKAKNLVGFKSHGMVLCAAEPKGEDGELVQFVEPPADAKIGEVISFDGLPVPEPLSASQVEKKKIFKLCLDGMKTTSDCKAAWNGHVFMTSAGPCTTKTIANGVLR
mmetsp:Transcript_26416/g.39046  ORF Transcript_26416/g.39046 Transcript_26416/m.39046 type:complete len:232 (-) Transcript_26416:92-787(-)